MTDKELMEIILDYDKNFEAYKWYKKANELGFFMKMKKKRTIHINIDSENSSMQFAFSCNEKVFYTHGRPGSPFNVFIRQMWKDALNK